MLPTRRLLALLLLPAPLLAAATAWPGLLAIAGLVWLTALALVGAEARRLAQPSQVSARRRHEPRLSLGADNVITWEIANRASIALPFRLRDEPPLDCRADALVLEGVAPAGGEARVQYRLRPLRRGDHHFGDVTLRWRGPLGFLWRQARYAAASPARVYPNLLEVRKYDILAQRGRLIEAGLRPSRRFGQGTEFETLRDYQPDDDYRRINWKATARHGRPMTVEYETERSQNVLVMLDAGRLMATEVYGLTKLDHAVNTSLLLGWVAAQRGDRVGVLAFVDRVLAYLPPRRGRGAFYSMLETLYNVAPTTVEPDFDRAFHFIRGRGLRRSLLVLFTDVTDRDLSSSLVDQLTRVGRDHRAVCVTLSDPAVLAAASGPVARTEDVYERVVAQRLVEERSEVLRGLHRRGVLTLDVPADRLSVAVINKYMELKARTGW